MKVYPPPCNTCIVQACCQKDCIDILGYYNIMADKLEAVSEKIRDKHLALLPIKRKRIIEAHIKYRVRYATDYMRERNLEHEWS
jgi:hypothetical protein